MKCTILNSLKKLSHEHRLILKPTKKNVIINFIAVAEMTIKAVTINKIMHDFIKKGMIGVRRTGFLTLINIINLQTGSNDLFCLENSTILKPSENFVKTNETSQANKQGCLPTFLYRLSNLDLLGK